MNERREPRSSPLVDVTGIMLAHTWGPPGRARMSTQSVTNALTIDFEDWYQGLEIPMSEWNGYEDRIVAVSRRLLDILSDAGVRATFFVLGYVADKHPELVREIA